MSSPLCASERDSSSKAMPIKPKMLYLTILAFGLTYVGVYLSFEGNIRHITLYQNFEEDRKDARRGARRESDQEGIGADGKNAFSLFRIFGELTNRRPPFVQGQSKKKIKWFSFSGMSEHESGKMVKIKPVLVHSVSCRKIFEGDEEETRKADLISELVKDKKKITVDSYNKMANNCTKFREVRGYIPKAVTKAEENFPIAFNILVYKDVWQVERLLRAIYRPQNYYCIHVDASRKSDVMREPLQKIVSCFKNVILPGRNVVVEWGKFSVLEADLICMEELWNRFKTWKYFINLTGQEFPLRTNHELVQILKAFDGANDVRASLKNSNNHRWKELPAPPHGIVPMTGSVHVTLHRKFVDFLLHDQKARDFLNWTKFTNIPDETFFSSLNYNPQLGVPGSYKGEPEMKANTNPYLSRFKNSGKDILDFPCKGFRVRSMCIFAAGDLPLLFKRRELFANKFYTTDNGIALDCMEEWYFNRTKNEYEGKLDFDTSYYRNLDFVKNKVK